MVSFYYPFEVIDRLYKFRISPAIMEKREFRKVKPMSCGETLTHPYTCQNILEHQLDFPQFQYEGDTVHSMYSDRMVEWDPAKYETLRRKHIGDTRQDWLANLDPYRIKLFLEDFLAEPIDGFRSIRFTHLGNGYPLWAFETYKKAQSSPEQKVYSGQSGPLVSMDAEEW